MSALVAEFDITGPLPEGLTVLEASAGTGKTWSLAGLVLRYVAETGLEASQLCVVSFTEAATAELRGRVREKLSAALDHLEHGTVEAGHDDHVIAGLLDDPGQRELRRSRVAAALADFDAATISTIHGFCSRVLAAGGGSGLEVQMTGDDSDVDEIVHDRFLARFGATGDWPAPPDRVAEAVRARLRMPDAVMHTVDPADVTRDTQVARAEQGLRAAALVDDIVEQVRERRAALRRRTFDSLLVEARDLLTGPRGATVRNALQRFRVVMIDEFQDTDRVQWDIFRTAFLEGDRPATVVVVGDPKQSIYRFRSAELSAYLAARAAAGTVTSLGTNWRSDAALLDGLEHLFRDLRFGAAGDDGVTFQPVKAGKAVAPPGLHDPSPDAAPVQFRCLDDELDPGSATLAARDDLVAEVVRLLEEATIADESAPGGQRPVTASDIGVLVRSNADATSFVAALAAAGVPAASSSNDSVLDSPAATQWRILLAALERPSSAPRARAAALTWFVGLGAAELDALDDEGASQLVEKLRSWAQCLTTGGLAALMASVRAEGLLGRVLGRPGGERDLTDLDHVLELLQSAVGGRPTAASALLAVLDDLTTPDKPGEEDIAPELLSRRIDRDDDTVKVLTVHRAKGLEFPIVLCPTLWRKRPNRQGVPHGQLGEGRAIDANWLLGGSGSGGKAFEKVTDVDKVERAGEDARLLYVALTRARHRLVVWWTPCGCSKNVLSPLGEVVHHSAGALDTQALAAASGGSIAAVAVPTSPPRRVLSRTTTEVDDLAVGTTTRELDLSWYQWSFSSIKARMEALAEEVAAAAARELPAVGGVDEPSEVVPPLEVAAPVVPPTTPLQGAPAGTAFGTLVHAALEEVDFSSPHLRAELRERVAELLHHRALPTTPDALVDGLLVALATPLGGPAGEGRLVDLTRADRLDELGFDLHLPRLDAREVARSVLAHLPADDRLRSWFEEAAEVGAPVDVAGLLTGSIDLVARTDGAYWLADYKTNLLPDGDYGPVALAAAMGHHGYPLQATLYLVALHRYLRWRLRGYDPDRHLAGAAYLFLRGMSPDAPVSADGTRPGVVWWRPPTTALVALDRLLAGAAGEEAA